MFSRQKLYAVSTLIYFIVGGFFVGYKLRKRIVDGTTSWVLNYNESSSDNAHTQSSDNGGTTLSCFEPNPHPISQHEQVPADRLINVGFPKVGSTSMQSFFNNITGGASHWTCNPTPMQYSGYCGLCIKKALQNDKPPLTTCGNFTVFAQLDYTSGECIYPQIQYLDELYKENPTATLLLPFRNVSRWITSLRSWEEPWTRKRNRTEPGKPWAEPANVDTENSLSTALEDTATFLSIIFMLQHQKLLKTMSGYIVNMSNTYDVSSTITRV